MPELPELEALRRALGPRMEGQLVTAAEVNPKQAHLLRYPHEEFQRAVPFRHVRSMWRRGKHLGWDLEDAGSHEMAHLVVNPMLGGRFQLVPRDVKPPGTWIFALRLENGEELRYFDFRAMGRIYFTADLADVPGWAELGPEADTVPQMGLEVFRKRLRRYRDEVKDLLRNQAFLAGIGNAYSDEIAWEAKLLPLRRRATLKPEDEEVLYRAIPTVLETAITAIVANPDYDESKQNRTFMHVHGKGGGTCPRCGHRISQLGSNREPLNFCRGCQV